MPSGQANSVLLLGVSSFGAQGTNAHALLSGTGTPAVIGAFGAGQAAPAWRRLCCYAAPPAQQLLTACLLRKRSRGGAAAFDVQLSAPRLAYLWQYSLQGRAHLPASALLSMAASLLPLLGAMAAGEDPSAATSLAAVAEAGLVAPAVLPAAAAARVAPAHARVKLIRGSGAAEVAFADQKLLSARLVSTPAMQAARQVDLGPRASASGLVLRRALLAGAASAAAPAGMLAAAGIVADLAPLPAGEASGYALHLLLLDACLGQAAAAGAAWVGAPLTWVRSVAALLVGAQSPAGGALTAVYQPLDSWHVGGAALAAPGAAAPAAAVLGVVLGDQDMPPASPGPGSVALRAGEAADAAALAAEEEAAAAEAVPADHPLLQMPEEERLLHLQAQVGAHVAAVPHPQFAQLEPVAAFAEGLPLPSTGISPPLDPSSCSVVHASLPSDHPWHLALAPTPAGDERGAGHAGPCCAARRAAHPGRPRLARRHGAAPLAG